MGSSMQTIQNQKQILFGSGVDYEVIAILLGRHVVKSKIKCNDIFIHTFANLVSPYRILQDLLAHFKQGYSPRDFLNKRSTVGKKRHAYLEFIANLIHSL